MPLLSFVEALLRSLDGITPVEGVELAPLWEGLGRPIGEPIKARRPSPLYTNSAMDGFVAVKGGRLRVKGEILAGDLRPVTLSPGECYYIATGAKVPEQGRFVAPIEEVELEGGWAQLPELPAGANIRERGEEFREGELLIEEGTELAPPEVLALTSQGVTWVKVRRPVQIGIYSTGDELVEPFQPGGDEQLYNSNSYGVYSLLRQAHFSPHLYPTLPDRLDRVVEELGRGLEELDLLVTIGGASKGRADHLRQGLAQLGVEVIVDGVNLKPGKPLLVGRKGRKMVVGLPGNLLSSYLNALLFLLPIARKMGGYRCYYPVLNRRKVGEKFRRNRKKWHFVLGRCDRGLFYPYRNYQYGSGMVTPLLRSREVGILPPGEPEVEVGSELWTTPLTPLFTDQLEPALKELR